ncbi:MAG: hypothetical protein KJ065_05905 [Anaerolineae bacterium]|nr:hypothetical protein [Anaerolineae bacterium]
MPSRFLAIIWGLLAALAVFFGIRTFLDFELNPPVIAALVALVLATLAAIFVPAVRRLLRQLLERLRAAPALYWLVLLVYLVLWISRWLVLYQPTAGWWISSIEFAYFFTGLWGLLFLLAYGFSSTQARTMAQKLGKSRLTGLLITLTTILVIFFLTEAYLRIFYITTDGYGFTAMNYHWYKNYGWAQDNSLGYRDNEPRPDAPGLIRIAVVGDSFAMGHGINNLDDTFAQILERRLGDCCDVNLLAESGWDTDLELPYLEQYPYPPNIVILSYYLNDIDYLLTDTAQDPNANFAFVKDPSLSWFVLNFFVPNYLYYNLLQFTSQTRAQAFVGDLASAYDNEQDWDEQRFRLNQIVDWTQARDMQLIVIVWPHITAIDYSQSAITKVQEVFEARAVPVVDMSGILREYPLNQLVVNRFDAHPSVLSHRLAADALEPTVREALSHIEQAG